MASAPTTLENLISLYRRQPSELEVRFHKIDPYVAATIWQALVDKKVPVDDGTISQTVNAIMVEDPSTQNSHHRGRSGGQKVNLLRQIEFVNGKKRGESFHRKWPLITPFRVRNPHALDYSVFLSGEQKLSGPFSSDASALIRVKCRVSFVLLGEGGNNWSIDLTVTRQLTGADAQSSLPGIVSKMFPPKAMTPANMFHMLNISDPDSEHRGLYQYELELEHLPGPAKEGRDGVRPKELSALVGKILELANPEYMEEAFYQAEIYHVAGFVVSAPGLLRRYEHEWGLKRLTTQVTALTRNEYKSIYPPTGYFLLDKADGVRAVASVRDGCLRILADTLTVYYAEGYGPEGKIGSARITANGSRVMNSTILDGELVRTAGEDPVFHAFDVVAVMGENVSASGYEDRITHLGEAVGVLRDFKLDARVKPIVNLSASEPGELRAQFQSPVFTQRPYGTDGRIIVEPGKPYSNTIAYKWKSHWDTTIDMLARRAPRAILGAPPYADKAGHELYILFVGINADLFDALGLERIPGYKSLFPTRPSRDNYFPIQFSPSDAPLAYLYQHPIKDPRGLSEGPGAPRGWEGWAREIEGKVIEMRCAGEDNTCAAAGRLGAPDWQIVRVREDRAREIKSQQYFGNDFRIAELTWTNNIDPFEEKQLWEGPTDGYFATPKSAMYRPQTAFTSFVKSLRIEAQLSHAAWVVDAAIGKGQDYGRYLKAGVRHLVGIDQDRGALSELIRRKYTHVGGHKSGKGHNKSRESTILFVLRADLTSPHADVSTKVRSIVGFPESGADSLVINLAIHYFADKFVNIRNFAALTRNLVKVGGVVIITTMFGSKVHDLLTAHNVAEGGSWDSRQGGVLKYSIRRGYADDALTAAGQRIGVLLPFSNGKYYDEYLVNVQELVTEFSARGFKLVEAPTFDSHFNEFKTRNPSEYKLLTPEDFVYLGLYGEIIFRREK